ncbi:protein still life, isoform SIF type 1-like, partial [Symsagittifera roscoffensis]|uniref:protein still life, isoform SIF type 1-like n=1 Tax=Symsagittifera roscoffensis TaxID=84072 RepID=UPI00307C9F68
IEVFVYQKDATNFCDSKEKRESVTSEDNENKSDDGQKCEKGSDLAEWVLLNDERLPVVIVCTQSEEEDPPNWKFQVTVEQGAGEKETKKSSTSCDPPATSFLDCLLTCPGTNLERTSPTFVEWKSKGSVWGLGFGSEKDALRFLSCCTPPNFVPSRNNPPLQPASHQSNQQKHHEKQTCSNPSSNKKSSTPSADRPKSVSNMEHFSTTSHQQQHNSQKANMNQHRPHIVPVQKPLSRPITDAVSSKRPAGMSPVMGSSPSGPTQPSTPMKVAGGRQHSNKDVHQVHITPSGHHGYTTAVRVPDESQYSSITVVPGSSQTKRPLMNRCG